MKTVIIVLTLAILAGCSFGCVSENNVSTDHSAFYSDETASEHSEVSLEEQYKEAAKIYPFLKSKYSVTAEKTMHDIKYEYEYYFVHGTVAGVKQTVILADAKSAEKYYDQIVEDCSQAILDDVTVIHFMVDDANCYGFDLDKLEFMLENSDFDYMLNFDKTEYLEKFGEKDD